MESLIKQKKPYCVRLLFCGSTRVRTADPLLVRQNFYLSFVFSFLPLFTQVSNYQLIVDKFFSYLLLILVFIVIFMVTFMVTLVSF